MYIINSIICMYLCGSFRLRNCCTYTGQGEIKKLQARRSQNESETIEVLNDTIIRSPCSCRTLSAPNSGILLIIYSDGHFDRFS